MLLASGKVYSYEIKQDVQNLARKNLERFNLASRVDFKLRDIQEGFDETDVDSLFLDVQIHKITFHRYARPSSLAVMCSLLPRSIKWNNYYIR